MYSELSRMNFNEYSLTLFNSVIEHDALYINNAGNTL